MHNGIHMLNVSPLYVCIAVVLLDMQKEDHAVTHAQYCGFIVWNNTVVEHWNVCVRNGAKEVSLSVYIASNSAHLISCFSMLCGCVFLLLSFTCSMLLPCMKLLQSTVKVERVTLLRMHEFRCWMQKLLDRIYYQLFSPYIDAY